MSILIGLTGGIGSGKSTILGLFKQHGVFTIESDNIGHSVLQKKLVVNKIKKCFGKNVLIGNKVDRKKLAQTVFTSDVLLCKLEKIVHPFIFKEIETIIKKKKTVQYIMIEIPLLFESGYYNKLDININVSCPIKQRVNRLKNKTISISDFKKRVKFQLSDKERNQLSDIVINNGGSLIQTKKRVKTIFLLISALQKPPKRL